jgi:transmembrane sensor
MTAEAPSPPPDWEAIARYLSGESSEEESMSVQRWLDANPADRELAEHLGEAARRGTEVVHGVDIEAALAKVHARMVDTAAPRFSVERGGGKARRWPRAVISGLIAAAIAAMVVQTRSPRRTTAPSAAVQTFATGVGRRDSVRLADGSRVVLGPQSRVTVPADFGATSRAVELTGDAYFDVHHDSLKPFSVRTNGALIEDLGTTFAVESDAGEGTRVSVVSGSVRLRSNESAPTSGVVLTAGDRGMLDAAGVVNVEHNSVRDEDIAWTTGRLVFNDAPLSRVIPEMQRWYGVTIQVADSALLRRTVHTSFSGESADKALEILGLTLGARIERHGDTATVTSARGPAGAR